MTLLENTPGLLDALRGEMTPKFLATRDGQGVPNVVPVVSIQPVDDQPDLLFFGNFLLRKSIRNLQDDPRVGVLVITPQLRGWRLTADFVEFQTTGRLVEQQMNSSMLRYNAYTGIRNAGLLRVRSVEGEFRIGKLQVLAEYGLARLSRLFGRERVPGVESSIRLPAPVQLEFARMIAVKVLAWTGDDGYPVVRPCLSLQPCGPRGLGAWVGGGLPVPPAGARVSANILTFEAISYQAKGIWSVRGSLGRLAVGQVYAGGPPLPGGRVA
jgi:hypothetical protein